MALEERSRRIGTLVVDDNPVFLEHLNRFLATEPAISVIGQARSGLEATEQVARLGPDLVLIDLAMPGMNGLEATVRIKAKPCPPRVIIVTLHDGPEYSQAALVAKADGFLPKGDLRSALMPMIAELFPRLPLPATRETDGETS